MQQHLTSNIYHQHYSTLSAWALRAKRWASLFDPAKYEVEAGSK
jgi:hypothetical protein